MERPVATDGGLGRFNGIKFGPSGPLQNRHLPSGGFMAAHSVRTVLEAVAEVSAERDLDALRGSLLQTTAEVLDCDGAAFWELPGEGAAPALPPFGVAVTAPTLKQLRAGSAVDLHDADGACVSLFPLARGEVLAIRTCGDATRPDDARVAQAMLRLYANFADLIAASEQDRLTGLFNRRSFDAQLARAAEACLPAALRERRGDGESAGRWLVLFDVDHFKRINDRFGHLYGDEVLLLLAQLLRRRFRGDDRCFRYGGEEFAVLLAPTEEAGARAAAERLRRDVESQSFARVGQVTISLGVARLRPGLGPTDVIDLADRALYEAKHGGRNRCVFAGDEGDGDAPAMARSFGEVELF